MSATLNTEETEIGRRGGVEKVLDKIDRIVEVGSPSLSNLVNPVGKTPCLPNSVTSVLSAAGKRMFEV